MSEPQRPRGGRPPHPVFTFFEKGKKSNALARCKLCPDGVCRSVAAECVNHIAFGCEGATAEQKLWLSRELERLERAQDARAGGRKRRRDDGKSLLHAAAAC